jgi:hypothetical protein
MSPDERPGRRRVIRPVDVVRLVRARFPPGDPVRLLVESWPPTMSPEEALVRASDVLVILAGGAR